MPLARALLVIMVALHVIAPCALADNPKQTRKILLIHSFEPFMPYSITVNQSIRSTLESDNTIHTDLYTEYLDLARFPGEDYRERLLDLLRHKYSRHAPDVIFVMLQPALDFLLKHIEGLFPEVPVVFCTIEQYQLEGQTLKPNMTGVLMEVDPKGTLDAALTLRPDTRKVLVLGGANKNDRGYEAAVRTAFKEYEGRLDITYMTGVPMETILKAVPHLPAHTIIFYITMFQDGTGKSFLPRDVATLISNTANMPVFSLFDSYFGYGIVGGRLVSIEEQGKKAAEMGLRILHGVKPADLSISVGPNVYMFDWRQMKRWGMSEKTLPPHSIVAYKKMTLWDQHGWLIIGIIVFLAIESLLIFILLMQRMMRRKAEAALHKSEEKYRIAHQRLFEIIEFLPDATFVIDHESKVIAWNKAIEAMTGIRKEDILGKGDYAYAVPFYGEARPILIDMILGGTEKNKSLYDMVTREGGTFVSEAYVPMPCQGKGAFLSITASPVFGTEGRTMGAVESIRDITEHKRVERELQESEERNRVVIDSSNDGIAIMKGDEHVYVNQRFVEIFGYDDPNEIIGKPNRTTVHPDDFRFVSDINIRRQRDESVPTRYEFKGIKKDGTPIYLDVSAIGTRYRGDPVSLVYLRDITERKEAEQELSKERGKLKTLSDNAPFGMALIDKDGHFTYINPKFTELFGFDLSDVPDGRTWFRKAYPNADYRHTVISAWIEDLTEAQPRMQKAKVFTVTCKNGTEKIVSFNASVLVSGDYLMTCEDITALKHLESQLRQSQKVQAIGTLTGGIAHDFNNILMAVMGYGALLKMNIGQDIPLRSYVDEILSGCEKAAQLIQSLLAFSRQRPVVLNPLSLNDIVRGAEKLLKRLVIEDIAVRTILTPDDIIVMADATQIDQILFNLATNARDAMPKGGTLTIETQAVEFDEEFKRYHGYGEPGRYALLSVADTGMGMDEATREKIFDPFFTTKEVGKGTGLGLSSVYGTVKQHKGYITVYSEPHVGTTFHIYLPVVSQGAEKEESALAPVKGGNETVLVAEDDEVVRRLLREVLRHHGYNVVEATDGADAIEKFKNTDGIDLLIFDSIMPVKNGREAYDEINTIRPGIKVLFTSGYTRDVILDKGIEDRKFHFISKPISPSILLQKVREVLDERRIPDL